MGGIRGKMNIRRELWITHTICYFVTILGKEGKLVLKY